MTRSLGGPLGGVGFGSSGGADGLRPARPATLSLTPATPDSTVWA